MGSARVERSGVFREDGFASVGSWVQAVANVSPATARLRVRLARVVEAHGSVGEALGSGSLGVEQAEAIARCTPIRTVGGSWRRSASMDGSSPSSARVAARCVS
jgi:hypothetical protein